MTIVLKKPVAKLQVAITDVGKTPNKIAVLIDELGTMLPKVAKTQSRIKALQKQLVPYAEKMKALTALVSALEG